MGYIYMLEDTRNGKKYIGKHIGNDKNYWSGGLIPNRIAKKYSKNIFDRIILENDISDDILNDREIFYIKQYNSTEDGYNLTNGGDGGDIISHNPNKEEIIKKISNSLKGRVFSEDHLINLKDNHMSKDPLNRQKLSEALKGKVKTEEHKLKLSIAAYEYNKKIKRWVGDDNPLNNKEIKEKISEHNKERGKLRRIENINNFIYVIKNNLINQTNIIKHKNNLYFWKKNINEVELNTLLPQNILDDFKKLCEKIKQENIKNRANNYKGFKHSEKTKEIFREKSKLKNKKRAEIYLKFCNDLYVLMKEKKLFLIDLFDNVEYSKIRKKIISSPFLQLLENEVKDTLLKIKTKEKIVKISDDHNKFYGNKNKSIVIDGVKYDSISDASKRLLIDRGIIRYRLKSEKYLTYIYI